MPFDFSQYLQPFAQSVQPNRPNLSQAFSPDFSGVPQQSTGLDRIIQLLQNQPQREEPSLLRKIGSALGSLQPAGYTQTGAPRGIQFNPERFESLKYKPYERKLQDFKTQLGAELPLAELEQKSKSEERLLRGQTFEQELKSAQFVQDLQKDARAGRLDEARIKEIEDRINRDDFINLGKQDDGSYLIMDKKSGQPVNIPGQNLTTEARTRMEQSIIGQRQRMLESQRQSGQLGLEGVRQEGQQKLEEMRQEGRTELEETRLEGRKELTRTPSPTQQSRDTYNRAMQVINENPDLREYIELLPNNTVNIPDASGGFFGVGKGDEDKRQRAFDLVYNPGLREEAINLLKEQGLSTDEEYVKKIMDQLRNK